MTDSPSADAEPSDAAVRGMVDALTEGWDVRSIEHSEHGTDAVATLDVRTPAGERRVVLKAATAAHVDADAARAEPRLLALVGARTSIPVPAVLGFCDEHDEFPAPFFLAEHVAGENYEDRIGELSVTARERVLKEAGRNLAALHELGPLPRPGTVGVPDDRAAERPRAAPPDEWTADDLATMEDDLAILEEPGRYADSRDLELENAEGALDALEDGGYFPELAEEPGRFADLVQELRSHVREAIPALPEPDPPTYCHTDYRYGNLLLDSETGAARAVLDWGNVVATDPAYNLALAESLLLTPDRDDADRTAELRAAFRDAYAGARAGWTFDEAVRERVDVYHLVCRLHAMACLPLWYEEPAERDRREGEHRAFVAEHLAGASARE